MTSLEIYNNLGDTTQIDDAIIINPVYQKNGVDFAKSQNAVFSLRLSYTNYHFGNPFSSDKNLIIKNNLIETKSTKESVINYIEWLLDYPQWNNIEIDRRKWIVSILKKGILKGKKIVYYKELNEPSHATALYFLINKFF